MVLYVVNIVYSLLSVLSMHISKKMRTRRVLPYEMWMSVTEYDLGNKLCGRSFTVCKWLMFWITVWYFAMVFKCKETILRLHQSFPGKGERNVTEFCPPECFPFFCLGDVHFFSSVWVINACPLYHPTEIWRRLLRNEKGANNFKLVRKSTGVCKRI